MRGGTEDLKEVKYNLPAGGRIRRTDSIAQRIKRKVVRSDLFYYYYKLLKSNREFKFQGEIYRYFCHKYNVTWRSERAVEIPIVYEVLKKHEAEKILEVGNVMSHYYPVDHVILDKYEKRPGVINEDVVDFRPIEKYDLIICVSTLEHVGWDENPREPMKIVKAVENLKNCLAPGKKMVVTLPLGSNHVMDDLLDKGQMLLTEMYCLKRIGKGNDWAEVEWKDAKNTEYDDYNIRANAVVIGIVENN